MRFCISIFLLAPVCLCHAASKQGRPLSEVAQIVMPVIDNAVLLAEDARNAGPGVAPRYALVVPTFMRPSTSGAWERRDFGQVWRLRIHSPAAVSLNLGFSRFRMPVGGELEISSLDGSMTRGPFTHLDNDAHGELWIPLIAADELVIEMRIPNDSEWDLELGWVNHGYREFPPTLALKSGSCNVDVICPEGDAWRDQIRSVAVISVGGSTFCSGFLVNNTAEDGTPYFMTAKHCNISADVAPSVVAYWNYGNSICRVPDSGASGGPGDGSLAQFNTGAIFRSSWSASDFTLVEFDDPIPSEAGAFLAGWDRTANDPSAAVAIHHPNTDEKRISFEDDPTTTTTYLESSSPGNGTHIRVADWDLGTTEVGSSGSPLFDQNRRVVGQLHGGYAACSNDDADWYGRFSVSWSGGGSNSTRLSNWLDPVGAGVVSIDGLNVNRMDDLFVIFSEGFEDPPPGSN